MTIDPRLTPPPAVLNEVIRRIVAAADPDKVILFGSGASGDMTAGSDLDVLVIKTGAHRRRLAQAIYRGLYGLGQAVDVVVVRPEDIERYRDVTHLIIAPALRAGRAIYERARS